MRTVVVQARIKRAKARVGTNGTKVRLIVQSQHTTGIVVARRIRTLVRRRADETTWTRRARSRDSARVGARVVGALVGLLRARRGGSCRLIVTIAIERHVRIDRRYARVLQRLVRNIGLTGTHGRQAHCRAAIRRVAAWIVEASATT